MSMFSDIRDAVDFDARDEVARLRKEIASLRRQVSKRGGEALSRGEGRLTDIYEDLRESLEDAVPALRSQARKVGRTAKEHQTALVVGAVVVGLIALLASSRR